MKSACACSGSLCSAIPEPSDEGGIGVIGGTETALQAAGGPNRPQRGGSGQVLVVFGRRLSRRMKCVTPRYVGMNPQILAFQFNVEPFSFMANLKLMSAAMVLRSYDLPAQIENVRVADPAIAAFGRCRRDG